MSGPLSPRPVCSPTSGIVWLIEGCLQTAPAGAAASRRLESGDSGAETGAVPVSATVPAERQSGEECGAVWWEAEWRSRWVWRRC